MFIELLLRNFNVSHKASDDVYWTITEKLILKHLKL